VLDEIVADLPDRPPDFYARYEALVASALAASGAVDAGRVHFERASRIYRGIGSVPGLLDLARSWDAARGASGPMPAPQDLTAGAAAHPRPGGQAVLQSVAALMLYAGRPDLLAREIVALLDDAGCVLRATAVMRDSDGQCQILATVGNAVASEETAQPEQRLSVGVVNERAVDVAIVPKADIESFATFHALKLLLASIREVERARTEREERTRLWPVDDVLEQGRTVVSGRMRELMSFARKVARTNVSVLITGESGTGKEVLARAIHESSDRAQKPFVPFNCTAIPRDMLESQLFGHCRGAFTGAERDNPGLIRAAAGGTLFLDEIGELSLDLQPKLLRFLESGEICPLGESAPFTVDVRVIAATNSNMEQLVRESRFREDLFYRLNIIPLRVPPLRERRDEIPGLVNHFVARAATECGKGQLRVAEETMEHLLLYRWPGNIRQLHNEVRRMAALAEPDSTLLPGDLDDGIAAIVAPAAVAARGKNEIVVHLDGQLMPTLSKIERDMIRLALGRLGGRLDLAARALGISRKGLYLKRQRLGL
jgi:hydrogenase-4 transcriptional activator